MNYPASLLRIAAFLTVVGLAFSGQTQLSASAQSRGVSPQDFNALQWRLIGPFRAGRVVAVSVDAVLPISQQTYQLQWSEDARDLQGRDLATTHWLASVTVAFDPPTDERGILSDPLGLYVTGISWTQHL